MTTLGRLAEDVVQCRTLMHAWRVEEVTRDGKEKILRLSCGRCGCDRWDRVAATGELVGRRYKLPLGYARVGQGRLARTDVRKELMRRYG